MGHLILEIRHKKKSASNYERLKTALFDYGVSVYIPPQVLHGATYTKEGVLIDELRPIREDFKV